MLTPLKPSAWSFEAAAHLLNRAGFGGTPAEIEALRRRGPEAAVESLLEFASVPDPTPDPEWARPDPDRLQRLVAARRAGEEERRKLLREEQQAQRQRI